MPTVFLTIFFIVPSLLFGFEGINYAELQNELNHLTQLPDLISTQTITSLPTEEATLAMENNVNEVIDQVSTTDSSIKKDEAINSESIDNRRKRKIRLPTPHKK